MKKLLSLTVAAFATAICFAQQHVDYGEGFSFNTTEEKDPKLVMADSYNTYMLSYINTDGMLSGHEVIIRKFDQKNQLVNTFRQAWPKLDNATLYNYVGWAQVPGNNKVVVFTESFSGKLDKQDLYQHVFDKATGAFTTTLVKSFPMEGSLLKKPSFDFAVSENKRFIGVLNAKSSSRKESVQNTVMVLDASTLSVVWSKEVPLDEKSSERTFIITNSGKAVLVRAGKGFKLSNSLTIASADKVENKELGEDVMLQDPRSVSIGNQDYLISFDYSAKGLRYGNFEKYMLYDIDGGKILTNNKMTILNNNNDAKSVETRHVFIQNNEFHIFVDIRVKAGTRAVKVSDFGSMTMDEPYYKYGPAFLIIMDFEGKIKKTVNINVDYNPLADTYASFGLVNVKGDYLMIGSGSNIYKLSSNDDFQIKDKDNIGFNPYATDGSESSGWKMVPQLFTYTPDSKKFIIGRFYNNKISLISVSN